MNPYDIRQLELLSQALVELRQDLTLITKNISNMPKKNVNRELFVELNEASDRLTKAQQLLATYPARTSIKIKSEYSQKIKDLK